MKNEIEWDSQIYILSKVKILISIFIFLPLLFLIVNYIANETIALVVGTIIITTVWPLTFRLMSDEEYGSLQIFFYKKADANYILSEKSIIVKYLKKTRLINYHDIISFSIVSPFNTGNDKELVYAKSIKYNVLYMAIKHSFYTEILPVFMPKSTTDEIISILSSKTKQDQYLNTGSNFLMNFGYLLSAIIILGSIIFVYLLNTGAI